MSDSLWVYKVRNKDGKVIDFKYQDYNKKMDEAEEIVRELCDRLDEAYNLDLEYRYRGLGIGGDTLDWVLSLSSSSLSLIVIVSFTFDNKCCITIKDDDLFSDIKDVFSYTSDSVSDFLVTAQNAIEHIVLSKGDKIINIV